VLCCNPKARQAGFKHHCETERTELPRSIPPGSIFAKKLAWNPSNAEAGLHTKARRSSFGPSQSGPAAGKNDATHFQSSPSTMRFSISLAVTAVWALTIDTRSGPGAAAVVAAENRVTPFGPADLLLLRRRLDDECTDQGTAYGRCLAGLADYESCLKCTVDFAPPEGASSFDDCSSRNSNLCARYEGCPCHDPCNEELSALYTCYLRVENPPCTISCGGGGGGGESTGSDSGTSGGSNSGGPAAGRVTSVASLALAAALAGGILA
jgi:uncharacterized membrane protein YgcG